jgi:transposase
MRIIGLDIHHAFAEAVAWQEGKLKRIGRIDVRRDQLRAFAASLLNTDVVVPAQEHHSVNPACPTADLCGPKGRAWLSEQILPDDERSAIERHLREFDRLGEDLR